MAKPLKRSLSYAVKQAFNNNDFFTHSTWYIHLKENNTEQKAVDN